MTKTTTRGLALLSLIAVFGPAAAMAQTPIPFTIPFGFTVGSQSFAAGNYRLAEMSPDVLRIQSEDGRANMVVIAMRGEHGKVAGKATMTFHRYGERNFLSQVSTDNRGWALRPSAGEKELIAGRAPLKPLEVIASSRR